MAKIYYYATDEYWRKEQKYKFLDERETIYKIDWQEIAPDKNHNWLNEGISADFEGFISIGNKEAKQAKGLDDSTIFKTFSNGVKTNRDIWAYNFNKDDLAKNINNTIDFYNEQVFKWTRTENKLKIKKLLEEKVSLSKILDDFVANDDSKIAWSETLKSNVGRENEIEFDNQKDTCSQFIAHFKLYIPILIEH